jgi:glycosyltransferase involved in cell wall biosynthesis
MTFCWAILTGEYPPQAGGVSDYTHLIARALAAAGDEVHVWAPPIAANGLPHVQRDEFGVEVHRLPDHFGRRGLKELGRDLRKLPPNRRVLLQYVPHAFGCKAMNIGLCLWLRARCPAPLWTTFHEVAFPWVARPIRHNLLAAANRVMALLVARGSERMFVTIPAWREQLAPLARRGAPITWTPVPSNLPTDADPIASAKVRRRFPSGPLIGHFGSFSGTVEPRLRELLPFLLRGDPARSVLLIGRGSDPFADDLVSQSPEMRGRLFATGMLQPTEVVNHLAACDLLVQPYLDGVSCRRSSLMASLALGLPIVTTRGEATESIWPESGAVALVPAKDPAAMSAQVDRLLADHEQRHALGAMAHSFYRENFPIERTVAALRQSTSVVQPVLAGVVQ